MESGVLSCRTGRVQRFADFSLATRVAQESIDKFPRIAPPQQSPARNLAFVSACVTRMVWATRCGRQSADRLGRVECPSLPNSNWLTPGLATGHVKRSPRSRPWRARPRSRRLLDDSSPASNRPGAAVEGRGIVGPASRSPLRTTPRGGPLRISVAGYESWRSPVRSSAS